jgi:nucleoside-diphosphate-sugar epimerase
VTLETLLTGKTVAIVGGAGFIGHHLALRLQGMGAHTHVIDGLQVNNLGYYTSVYAHDPRAELYLQFINERLLLLRTAGVSLHILDARDYTLVSNTLNTISPDVVIHLAAIAHANRSNKDPYSTFDHSMRTLENVLDSVRSTGTQLVYLSSSMVYGDFQSSTVAEDALCNPKGIYGALKFGAEKLVQAYGEVFATPYTIIRPSALYGQRCVSRRVGQAFIENALAGEDLTVNGDGLDSLDFTYIDDFINGVILTLGNESAFDEIFNVTYGNSRPINDLAAIVQYRFPNIKLLHLEKDSLMPERGTLDISKARDLLGYAPEFPIELGMQHYIDWYEGLPQ